jgi:hypothetical protein
MRWILGVLATTYALNVLYGLAVQWGWIEWIERKGLA